MATINLTPNLKLRVSSDLNIDSRYNLYRLDALASVYQIDSTDTAIVRSSGNIILQPNSSDIGGTGSGGTVQFGTVDQPLTNLSINAESASFASGVALDDQAVGGDKKLNLKYQSDLNGLVDTVESRTLNIDLDGADRDLILGANFTLISNNLSITAPIVTNWTLPPNNGTSGNVLSTDGAGGLSWVALNTTLGGLSDVSISSPTSGQILAYNGSSWVNQSSGASIQQLVETWSNADGTTKTITHAFNTRNVNVQVINNDDSYRTVDVDSVSRPSDTTVILESSMAPTGAWTVLITTVT